MRMGSVIWETTQASGVTASIADARMIATFATAEGRRSGGLLPDGKSRADSEQ